MEKLIKKFFNTITEINTIDDIAEIHKVADEMLKKEAISLFLDMYPNGKDIVLLDNTIEGLVGIQWKILNLSPHFLNCMQKYWVAVRNEINAQRDVRLGYCFSCERKFIMLPNIPKKKAQKVAKRLIKQHRLIAINSLCPNCCSDLKTDSDYEGLTYIN
jgi:hypothetical protein